LTTTALDKTTPDGVAAGGGGSRHWALALKLLVSLGLLVLVARSVDLASVGALLLDLPFWAGLAAVASLTGIGLVSAVRWWLVMRAIGAPLPLGRITALMFVGNFFTQVLPTSIGGDAVRIWQASREGIAFDRAFIGVMLERITGLIALVVMVALGVFWLGERMDPPVLRFVLLACLPVLAGGLLMLCLLDRLPARLADRLLTLPLFGRLLGLLGVMAADTRRVLLAQPLSSGLLLLSAAAQVFSALAVLALAQGLGLALSPLAALAVVPAIILITFIPLSFAGWGVREGASIIMLGLAGIGADQAVTVSVLFGLALLVAGLPGCLLWVLGERRLPSRPAP
jgi:uncharacterized membrane protein YbhN (UPF0104 family)